MTSAGLSCFSHDCAKRIDAGPSDDHFHYFAELLALHEQFYGDKCPEVIKKSANIFITMYGKNPKYGEEAKMAFVYYLLGKYSKTMDVNTVMKTLYDNNRFHKVAVFYELWIGGLIDREKRKEAQEVLNLAKKNHAQPARLIDKLELQMRQLSPILPVLQKTPIEHKTPLAMQKGRPSLLTASVRKSLSTPPNTYREIKSPKGTPRKFTLRAQKTAGTPQNGSRQGVLSQTNKHNLPESEPEDEMMKEAPALQPDNMALKLEPTVIPETSQFQFHRIRASSATMETTTIEKTSNVSPVASKEGKENSMDEESFRAAKDISFNFADFVADTTNRRLSTFERRRQSRKGGISFAEQSTVGRPSLFALPGASELQNAINNLCLDSNPIVTDTKKRNPFKL